MCAKENTKGSGKKGSGPRCVGAACKVKKVEIRSRPLSPASQKANAAVYRTRQAPERIKRGTVMRMVGGRAVMTQAGTKACCAA